MVKQRYSQRPPAFAAGLWSHAALALAKGVVGLLFGSSALIADAFRSALESASIYASLLGARFAARPPKRPADPARRYQGEQAVHLALAVLLLVVGIEIGVSAVRDVANGANEAPGWPALAVLGASLLVKLLFLPSHRRKQDVYLTGIALAGAGGAWIGGAIGEPLLLYLDPAAACAIGIALTAQGYRLAAVQLLARNSSGLAKKDEAAIAAAVQRVEGVIALEELHVWEQGHYVAAVVTISVNPRITVLEGQEIARRVKERLLERFTDVIDVRVLVDPYDAGYPYKSNHDPNQEHIPTLLQ